MFKLYYIINILVVVQTAFQSEMSLLRIVAVNAPGINNVSPTKQFIHLWQSSPQPFTQCSQYHVHILTIKSSY